MILAREAIKLTIGAMILAFDGYILVRVANKLVIDAIKHSLDDYILAIDGHILVPKARKLFVIASFGTKCGYLKRIDCLALPNKKRLTQFAIK
jgi:hypothetical protein